MNDCSFNETCKHSGKCKKKCGGYPRLNLEQRAAFARASNKKFGSHYSSNMSKEVRDELERTSAMKGSNISERRK
jgi:hypothetical protein